MLHPFTNIFYKILYLALHEKQKALETKVVKTEMKREAQKKVLAEELHSLQAVKEENKNVETQLAMAQSKITSLTKVKEGLKHQASSSDKENSSDKLVAPSFKFRQEL